MSPRLRIYVALVMVAAAVLLALSVPRDLAVRWPHYLAWVLVCLLCESLWVNTLSGAGTLSMASTANLATAILWGPGPAMWITATSSLIAELLVQRKPWVRAGFNAAQITITLWVACALFASLGGPAGGLESLGAPAHPARAALALALPLVTLFAGYLLVNRALVAVAVAWSTDRRWLTTLRQDYFYAERLLDDAAAFLMSPLMVISFLAVDYVGLVLFYAPLRMIRESTRRQAEIRRAQQQLIHSERMAAKGEMAAEIAHEVRNLLATISARAQMLVRDAERSFFDHVPHHAEIVLEQAGHMEALARGLVDFTRAELSIESVDLNRLVERTVELVRTQSRFEGVEWEMSLAEPVPELMGDPGQLQQVMINLFLNAADALHERANGRRVIRVTSAWDESARQVSLSVADTGPGIPAGDLGRIFEPRFTTKRSGHGFGLSTSYRIITNHGGRIVAESPPGEGATFTLTLPQGRPGGRS
ncbi:MAG TPA: ATP-binding protein [Candidatus Eisenbacteria bacterium]|jgi:signal transduction histidine kinase